MDMRKFHGKMAVRGMDYRVRLTAAQLRDRVTNREKSSSAAPSAGAAATKAVVMSDVAVYAIFISARVRLWTLGVPCRALKTLKPRASGALCTSLGKAMVPEFFSFFSIAVSRIKEYATLFDYVSTTSATAPRRQQVRNEDRTMFAQLFLLST